MAIKRVVAIGDFHCGHVAGLTPPEWFSNGTNAPTEAAIQAETWRRYIELAKRLQPVYAVFLNGDLIDGRGERSGGTELVTTDMIDQCEIAVTCANVWRPKAGFVQTYGTPYHTGQAEDFERLIAGKLGAEIHSHCWPEVDGVVFDLKHKVGSSSVPHARHTAIAREKLWNELWSEHERTPKAQIVLRSHVHYHSYSGGPGWLGMTLPALQAAHTKYGSRQCSGTVHWGVTWFDIENGEVRSWQSEIVYLQAERSTTLPL